MAIPSPIVLPSSLQTPPVDVSTDDDLIREGEAAVDHFLDSARRQILPMARGLLAAKRRYPATQDFGNWLQASPYRKLGQTARAALIHIGEHEETASRFIHTTSLTSPETIWGAVKKKLLLPPSSATSEVRKSRNSPSIPEPSSEATATTSPAGESSPNPIPAPTPTLASSRMTVRCGFAKAPRAEEIYEIFQHKEARATLARVWRGKCGREIWDLIVTALDGGLLAQNNRAFSTPSLWLLFPSAPAGKVYHDLWDLQDPGANLSYIKNVLLPLMIDHRDKLLATPERAEEILTECVENRKRSIIRAETPLLSHTPDNAKSDSSASIDLLIGEIESRIEKLARLRDSMDAAHKQRLVGLLDRLVEMQLEPAPESELETSSNG